MEKTKIRIKRLPCVFGCAAKCKIELDGICVAKVANGKSVEFWADKGIHTLTIYWGWKKTNVEINVNQDDEISLVAKVNIAKDRFDFYSSDNKLLSNDSNKDPAVGVTSQKGNTNFARRDIVVIVSAIVVVFLCVVGILLASNSTVSENDNVIITESGNMDEDSHKHDWKEATCEESTVCLSCGEVKGEKLGHTTDCGICTRCNKEFRKNSPVTILNWTYNIDYVGGVEWNFRIKNNTDKQIKYVTMQWDCYNAVGDLIYDEISWKSYVRVRFTGPLDAHSTSGSKRNTDKFYNHNLKSYKMTEIIVEYMDGTTEKVTQYHDNILG